MSLKSKKIAEKVDIVLYLVQNWKRILGGALIIISCFTVFFLVVLETQVTRVNSLHGKIIRFGAGRPAYKSQPATNLIFVETENGRIVQVQRHFITNLTIGQQVTIGVYEHQLTRRKEYQIEAN